MNVRRGHLGSGCVDVVVVGAGQAGLAVSYYLRAFGIEHVVLERGRVGESWRSARWDSFTLVTPNWMTRLPGHVLASGTGADFIARDAIVGLLESFADGLPVTDGVEVVSVTTDDHGYLAAGSRAHRSPTSWPPRDARCCWPPAGWRVCRAATGAVTCTSGASSLACTTRQPRR